ncbi:hypothetical protein POPTR_002G075700v4 [Populus trichocarpa]|uniref:Staygreen protein domain-containing protein n=1 Tax=Populus trichocarpa TaxID=3694 RepID=B9GTY1_POPTR|nr:magnesium dechelatase SGRL, chloroplastic isoform X2 [Populus trichocarpa]KAI5597488.1 hypothetical protein BDE02_02G069300 [Populus trichocarpa]PNT48370.1 hypothetical protein POPTR_002G075700v4 [Populus trichocarpa]|eukprot:XP_002302208.2 protein STAY-GREEN LIKE, chloroplastic isoform X2 [Populus trichocarpa]
MACHCAHYAFSPSPHMRYFSINNITKLSSKVTKPTVLSSIDNSRASYNTLVSEAVRLLGPPAKFEASKLKVVLMGEEMNQYSAIIPRTYILSHCDFTADLTLIISNVINLDQLRGWYSKDDVVVEWKKLEGQLALHAHCYVSGPNLLLDLAAEFRYHIFSKEMPLVLEAVLDGDAALFTKHPELKDSLVWVYFHSRLPKYNRLECWGPLKDAAQGRPRDQRGFSVASKASSRISRKSG